MDDAESIELVEESLEDFGPTAKITLKVRFKSGLEDTISFSAPVWTPIYAEPITGESIYAIIASAYSYGEAPFFAVPTDEGTYKFFDLSATDFMEVEVEYTDEPE